MRAREPAVGTVRREDGELNHAGDGKQTPTLAGHQDAAVLSGDTTCVLRDDAAGIVMFDVPPPDEDASGIDAYGQTWPPLFRRLAQGALFQIASRTSRTATTSPMTTPCCAADRPRLGDDPQDGPSHQRTALPRHRWSRLAERCMV
jgi:hypothetical protein